LKIEYAIESIQSLEDGERIPTQFLSVKMLKIFSTLLFRGPYFSTANKGELP